MAPNKRKVSDLTTDQGNSPSRRDECDELDKVDQNKNDVKFDTPLDGYGVNV